MTTTPWGDSDELRARKLSPGPGATREQVEANQRERLCGAMVAAVAEHGYEATRVADVLEISGVSRNTFYKHYDNKLDCFLATMDAVLLCGGSSVVATYLAHPGPWDARLADGLDALIATLVAQPAAARLFYVESFAAGPSAVAKVDEFGDRIFQIARRSLDESPDYAGMSTELLRAVLRGIRRVMQSRLRSGRETELTEIGPQLFQWSIAYQTPPQPLARPAEPPPHRFRVQPPDPDDPRERIMTAVMELMATKGYQALTITDIAQQGALSLTTFYRHFQGKDDAVVAALRRSTEQIAEAVSPAFHKQADWPQAIGAGMRAFFAFLVFERPFARFGGVDVHSSSRLVLDVRAQLLSTAQAFLAEGYRQHPEVEPIVAEAIGASIDALVFDQIMRHGEKRLYEITPTATYIALVPFVGVDEACAIANAGA
ncbi:MAG TPA: TetR/AcrR family transcriptional regulator [Thermoleophilaceae bacterium]|nr:TetR/AcrR family transcriptional regulator [Thermoleophilaceae bacterium]